MPESIEIKRLKIDVNQIFIHTKEITFPLSQLTTMRKAPVTLFTKSERYFIYFANGKHEELTSETYNAIIQSINELSYSTF